ncbi:hypothetical protein Plhal304r1_c046g0127181 [Plasmopara halstedii]
MPIWTVSCVRGPKQIHDKKLNFPTDISFCVINKKNKYKIIHAHLVKALKGSMVYLHLVFFCRLC